MSEIYNNVEAVSESDVSTKPPIYHNGSVAAVIANFEEIAKHKEDETERKKITCVVRPKINNERNEDADEGVKEKADVEWEKKSCMLTSKNIYTYNVYDGNCEAKLAIERQCSEESLDRKEGEEREESGSGMMPRMQLERDDADATNTAVDSEDDTENGVEEMPEEDVNLVHVSTECYDFGESTSELVVLENTVISNTGSVTHTSEAIFNTSSSLNDEEEKTLTETLTDSANVVRVNRSVSVLKSLESYHGLSSEPQRSDGDFTKSDMTAQPKGLKSLLKRRPAGSDAMCSEKKGKKRVTFSETMMVFCEDWPPSLMPQIIAVKSPTDFNLVEVQGYMFEPPLEYQDFLPFEPPPDYRDFISSSMSAYEDDLSINFIDDDDYDEDDDLHNRNSLRNFNSKFSRDRNEQKAKDLYVSSALENMILNDSAAIEEEQIIGVLKQDAILQAIGSHVSLPEEHLSSDDMRNFHGKENSDKTNKAGCEKTDHINFETNESSPTGSLQDMASDSSITSQDTIILMTNDDNTKRSPLFSNFERDNRPDIINSTTSARESHEKARGNLPDINITSDNIDNSKINFPNETSLAKTKGPPINETLADSDTVTPDVTSTDCVERDQLDQMVQEESTTAQEREDNSANELVENENDRWQHQQTETNSQSFSEANGTKEVEVNQEELFKRNLAFYENIGNRRVLANINENIYQNVPNSTSNANPNTNTCSGVNRVSSLICIQSNNCGANETPLDKSMQQLSLNNNQNKNEQINQELAQKVQSQHLSHPNQTQQNRWSTDEFIIEYTSEPRTLVPSKRTSSLSSFIKASANASPFQPTNTNSNYMSLNRNFNTQGLRLYQQPHQQQFHQPQNQQHIQQQQILQNYYQRQHFEQQLAAKQFPSQQNAHQHHTLHLQQSSNQPKQYSQTLPHPRTYHSSLNQNHLQQSNEFPHPSEIRRRDGLNAYPHVWQQPPQPGALPVPPVSQTQCHPPTQQAKDELEQFVQQDQERIDRIKKRYSLTEEDDPTFGFARRPSVRGIRPRNTTNDSAANQMSTQSAPSHIMAPVYVQTCPVASSQDRAQPHLQPNPQIVQIRLNQQQQSFPVKHVMHLHTADGIAHLNHPQRIIKGEGGVVIHMFANSNNLTNEQIKQKIQQQLQQRFIMQQQKQVQQKQLQQMVQQSKPAPAGGVGKPNKPILSSKDERSAPEGVSASPKHLSDVPLTKSSATASASAGAASDPSAKHSLSTDTKSLVNNEANETGKLPGRKEGVIYYSMNV